MNKLKRIIKLSIRYLSELCAIVYPYEIILIITNAKDEITIVNSILTFIYVVLAINIFEWAWGDK